ncbi:hypothetical protein HY621_03930 [Candidatus Uhrbacteria bacterium]|nr:hypothetical protein [Candidatus Uhrbacteria bacterium]
MNPITVFTIYIRTQKRWRYASAMAVFVLVFAGVFGFASKGEAFVAPLLIGGALTLFTGALAVKMFQDQILGGIVVIVEGILKALTGLFLVVINMIVDVSQYTQFIDSIPVTRGWEIIRDLCNMFFVLILLAIAIGTILQHEKYTYSKTLPKLISAAILINFSKTIAGLAIDFSNIVMLTFVGAVENTAGGNFVGLLGIDQFLNYASAAGPAKVDVVGVFASLILAFIFMVIALVVVVVMLYILIARVVALWFLVVLSPAAFFLSALPDDKGFGKKWWDQFVNYLIVGPIMMFFLWLSFTTLQLAGGSNPDARPELGTVISAVPPVDPNALSGFSGSVGTALGSPQSTLGTFLGIVMLLGSMVVAQQLGVEGGKMAGGVVEGARAYAAGKKGPSPMRWARERYDMFSKMRQKAREEKVKESLVRWGRPIGVAAAAVGGAKDMAAKWVATRDIMKKPREMWNKMYTEPKRALAEKLADLAGDAQDQKNKSGETEQEARNRRERAARLESKPDDFRRMKAVLAEEIEQAEREFPENESDEERGKRLKRIEGMKKKMTELEDDAKLAESPAALLARRAELERERDEKAQQVDEKAKEADDASLRGNINELKKKASELQALKDDLDGISNKIESVDGILTPDGKRRKADRIEENAKDLEDKANTSKLTDKEFEEKYGKSKAEMLGEADEFKKQAIKERGYADFLDGRKEDPDGGFAALKKKIASDLRSEAVGLDMDSDKYKLNAQSLEFKGAIARGMSLAPDVMLRSGQFAGAAVLSAVGGGAGLLLPYLGDMANGIDGFGRRVMRDMDDLQNETIASAQKHVSGLRDEVVKAIAAGAVKGFSNTDQMAAQKEMMKRQLYTTEEIDGARTLFAQRGGRAGALEAFDFDVWSKYPSQAFGMTPEQLVHLLEKGRISLKDIASRPDAISADLLKAINRLANNISAGHLMDMKSNPIIEAAMKSASIKSIKEMREQGKDKDKDGNATHDFMMMGKTAGMTRAYIDNPDLFNITKDGFQGPDREFNERLFENAMKDDDVAPYMILTLHNSLLQNPDTPIMKMITKYLDPEGSDNPDMATHVMAAIRNMAGKLADRGKANGANIMAGITANIEAAEFSKRLGKDFAVELKNMNIRIPDLENPFSTLEIKDVFQSLADQLGEEGHAIVTKIKKDGREWLKENSRFYARNAWGQDRF